MGPSARSLPLGHALALGLVHGPAEVLPISSSAHVTLLPWLAGWPYERLDPAIRKSFEVALHAGSLAGLAWAWRGGAHEAVGALDVRSVALLGVACLPPALAGVVLEGPIERRLGTPGATAAGLAAGSLALALAERAPGRRSAGDAGAADALALGLAQAFALAPGVSRAASALAAARLRGFAPAEAAILTRVAGVPVLLGATARRAARPVPRDLRAPFALGALGAAASTLTAGRAVGATPRSSQLAPYVAYRLALAALVAWRARRRRG